MSVTIGVTSRLVNWAGMENLREWTLESCVAHVAEGADPDGREWATVYWIESSRPGCKHAQALLQHLKSKYAETKTQFASTIALNPAMRHILKKLSIKEHNGEESDEEDWERAN